MMILKRIFNKEGINDGVVYELVDERFNLISIHKSYELADKKRKEIKKKRKNIFDVIYINEIEGKDYFEVTINEDTWAVKTIKEALDYIRFLILKKFDKKEGKL